MTKENIKKKVKIEEEICPNSFTFIQIADSGLITVATAVNRDSSIPTRK